ncbi:FIST N-terminal domain-containing protein [Shimia ponticola]|uniref:FIST N-terminal domain-containing protein n=1 Tax=Shimia ponticola TaxID=2582893 RepID=UPI002107ECD2|nr:FIST N-terminal domain-containing protein [Shimia ponticola]
MTHTFRPIPQGDVLRHGNTLLSAQVPIHADDPVGQIARAFDGCALAQLFLFVSADADFSSVVEQVSAALAPTPVVACTTAGEIGHTGYIDNHILAIGLPRTHFATRIQVIENLGGSGLTQDLDRVVQGRVALSSANPDKPNGFAFLMVDGLSLKEDLLVSALAPTLGNFKIFGGSAGDGVRFTKTLVAANGRVMRNAAVLTLVVSHCEVRVFSLDHMEPTQRRMVVTGADPDQRIVKEINAEPAAAEFARLVGKDPAQLNEFTFAAHPVVVRLGDEHHVRAIQRVNSKGELVFFSAIDEGMVLTVASAMNMPTHLDQKFAELAKGRAAPDILGCDCILRRIEAEQTQSFGAVSRILEKHRVLGFSTYGEQIGPMHVNHTMTGVAIFPPTQSAG